jgi:hypothetical protein
VAAGLEALEVPAGMRAPVAQRAAVAAGLEALEVPKAELQVTVEMPERGVRAARPHSSSPAQPSWTGTSFHCNTSARSRTTILPG